MSGSAAVQNPWPRYRAPWRRPLPPLHRYEYEHADTPPPEGKGPSAAAAEPRHLRMLSLPRLGAGARDGASGGSLRRIFPYLRSMSDPNGATATAADPERRAAPLRKAGSDAERRTPSVSSFIHSFSRRISRVLRERPDGEEAAATESGRRRHRGRERVRLHHSQDQYALIHFTTLEMWKITQTLLVQVVMRRFLADTDIC